MYARGLCKSCSDFYLAWAYYHEIAGDFKTADTIFEMGKSVVAQPFEQLYLAHHNLLIAAGQHVRHFPQHLSVTKVRISTGHRQNG